MYTIKYADKVNCLCENNVKYKRNLGEIFVGCGSVSGRCFADTSECTCVKGFSSANTSIGSYVLN